MSNDPLVGIPPPFRGQNAVTLPKGHTGASGAGRPAVLGGKRSGLRLRRSAGICSECQVSPGYWGSFQTPGVTVAPRMPCR